MLGLARNKRLIRAIGAELEEARHEAERTERPARRFKDFRYQTRKSWSLKRRGVGKAEQLPGKSNPRFAVTSLSPERIRASTLYKKTYCARGDMENRIKGTTAASRCAGQRPSKASCCDGGSIRPASSTCPARARRPRLCAPGTRSASPPIAPS